MNNKTWGITPCHHFVDKQQKQGILIAPNQIHSIDHKVCVVAVSKKKDASSDLREAIAAAHPSGKCYMGIFKHFEVLHSTVRNYSQVESIQDSYQSSQDWISMEIHSKVKLCNA